MDNDLIQDTNLDLLQVNAVEVEYSGISPINVDNQEHTISLDPSALSSKLDTSAFDEWTATHSAGEEYSAGEGIDITDHVISYTGDPGDATPWISGNKIITSADTMQPGEFIQVVSSFDLSGNKNHFITMKGQGYYFPTNQQLKERVDISSYLPTSAFSSYTASIASNLENNWNYTNSAYSQSLNNYYNKLDISAFSSWSSEHSGDYLTKESADTLYQPIGDYQTAGNYQTAGDYLSATDSALFYPIEGNPSGFLTGVDLSNYYEKNETSSKEEIENAITSVENIINNLSGEYYPLTSNPSGYLTAHQSLDDYQKTADMTAYQEAGDYYSASNPSGFITGVDLSNYYEKNETSSKEEISNALTAIDNTISGLTGEFQEKGDYYSASNPSGFITGVDLTPYQEKTGMTAYQPVGDYYSASNPSGFITGVDLSNYYEKNETSSKEEISAALTGKLDESAFTAYTATAVQGIEYTGIAPIDVNNTTHEISADVWTLSGNNGIDIVEDAQNKVTTITLTSIPGGGLTALSAYYKKDETSSKEEIANALEDVGYELHSVEPVYISNDNDIGVMTWQLVPGNNVVFTENSATLQTVISVTGVPTGGDYLPLSAYNAAVGYQVHASALGLAQGSQASARDCSFAEGSEVSALHIASVQGLSATAYDCAMTQGYEVSARQCAFAQGAQTTADFCSLAQGGHCSAWSASIAQGEYNTASLYSQAFGDHVIAHDHTMAIGAYNKTSANTPFVIGNGTNEANRSDLFIINSTGGVSALGKISANGVELGAGGGGETTAYSSLSAQTISGAILDYTQGKIRTISSNEIKINDNYVIPKTNYYNVHETVIHSANASTSTTNDISTNFVYNNVYDTVTGQIDSRYHNYTFGNNGEYIGYDTRIDVTLPFTATQVRFTACDTDYNQIYTGILTSNEGKSEWTIEPTDFNINYSHAYHSNEIAKIQIGDFVSTVKTGVITAKLINAVDEVFATQPWVLSQLTGQGAGFPITGMDGSTVYSANCNGSSFNIRSQYSTTYFAPRSLYHAHSPSYGASAEYSDIIDVANTFCTAIPCVTVANSGMATGQNILYIVTGN